MKKSNVFIASRKDNNYKSDGKDYYLFFSRGDVNKFLRRNMDYYIRKDVSFNILENWVRYWIRMRDENKGDYALGYRDCYFVYDLIDECGNECVELGKVNRVIEKENIFHFELCDINGKGCKLVNLNTYLRRSSIHKSNQLDQNFDKREIVTDGSRTLKKDKHIYFIQDEATKSIKIGISFNVQTRLEQIQNMCPSKLILLKCIKGGIDKEKELHERFSEHRLHGEWFRENEELENFIEGL